MTVADIHGLSVDIDRVRTAIGGVPRVAYEAAHVYPLSAPRFTPRPGAERERPDRRTAAPLCPHSVLPLRLHLLLLCQAHQHAAGARCSAMSMRWVASSIASVTKPRCASSTSAAARRRRCRRTCSMPRCRRSASDCRWMRAGVIRWNAHPNRSPPARRHVAAARHQARQPRRADARRGAAAVDQPPARCPAGARRLRAAAAQRSNSERRSDLRLFQVRARTAMRRDLEAFAALGVQSFTLYNLRLNERTPLATAADEIRRIELPNLMRWRRFVNLVTRRARISPDALAHVPAPRGRRVRSRSRARHQRLRRGSRARHRRERLLAPG